MQLANTPGRQLAAGLLTALLCACQGAPLPSNAPTASTVPTAAPTVASSPRVTQPPSPPPVTGLVREVVIALAEDPGVAAVADFDRDGIVDIVTANDGTISLLLGIGGGAFEAKTIETGGNGPPGIAVADLNGDHRLDIAIVHSGVTHKGSGSDDLVILLGEGDGSFTAALTVTGVNAQAVVVGDFDLDGHPDLATANHGDHISVFRGLGRGTFDDPKSYPIGAPYASGISVADIDRDGDLDLVTANSLIGRGQSARTVSVLRGGEGASFGAPTVYDVGGPQPILPLVADLNGDGFPDVITPDGFPTNDVSVLLSNAEGDLAKSVEYETGPSPHSVVAGDLDGDGHMDLATWNSGEMGGPVGQGFSMLFSNGGDGTFQPHVDYKTEATGGEVAAAVDLDGDGRLDILLIASSALVLLFNTMAP